MQRILRCFKIAWVPWFRRNTLKAAQNPYDAVAYPGFSYRNTHPDNLATMATLHGLSPAPVERCRVLEIACGDGANLIPMAYAIPQSEFVGLDLAALPIERGQRQIRELGLGNIRLMHADLLDAGAELGRFDYIIAHGLYAWVPEPVRDRLMWLCGELLTADGVAFISYNAKPGGHLRAMIREMMLFGGRGIEDPEQEVAAGLKFLQFIAGALPENDVNRVLLQSQLQRMETHRPEAVRHDEMSDVYHPVHFVDFVEHARTYGLQYLSEARLPSPSDPVYRTEIQPALESASGGDFLSREQLLDFVRMRGYRETLLCRADRVVQREFPAERFRRLLFASQTMAEPSATAGATAFVLPGGIRMESNHPGVTTLLQELGDAWPRARSFAEMEARLASAGLALDEAGAALLMQLTIAKMIELRSWNPPVARVIGERPRASACSRQEAATQANVTTLLHEIAAFEDTKIRHLLGLLDGTRDRGALAEAMGRDFPELAGPEIEAGIESGLELFLKAGALES
jgi:SAM-dependent methyltransferase